MELEHTLQKTQRLLGFIYKPHFIIPENVNVCMNPGSYYLIPSFPNYGFKWNPFLCSQLYFNKVQGSQQFSRCKVLIEFLNKLGVDD